MEFHKLSKQFEVYTNQELEKSKLAHDLQLIVGHPRDSEYKAVMSNKLLPNLTIITYEIINVNSMFGPDLSGMRVNTVINKPSLVDMEEYVQIPEYFYKLRIL